MLELIVPSVKHVCILTIFTLTNITLLAQSKKELLARLAETEKRISVLEQMYVTTQQIHKELFNENKRIKAENSISSDSIRLMTVRLKDLEYRMSVTKATIESVYKDMNVLRQNQNNQSKEKTHEISLPSNSENIKPLYISTPVPVKQRSSGRTYHTGPRGGCYYINDNGNKTYVDRSLCR